MVSRILTDNERETLLAPLLDEIRHRLEELSGGDTHLLWALRRKLTKELGYDERGKPMHRKMLKLKKMAAQKGLCAVCGKELPEKNSVLDRLQAMGGYTGENTRLICRECDIKIQEERGYR
jgi:ribosomal protein L44E